MIFPLRAFLIGLFMVGLINVGAPYSMFVLKSSQWAISYLPLSVVFLFTALVFANAALKSTLRIAGLSPGELGIVFIMSLVGASIPTWGTSTYMIAVIAAPKFFASPENQWQEKVVQYAKDWLMPRDDIALKWFYNGLPAGESIPWGAWIAPLFWWTSLVVAIFFLCHCLSSRTAQTVGRTRATPVCPNGVPRQLIEPPPGSNWPGFVRKPVFWIGFAIPFFMVMWNVVTYFTPAFPPIPRDLSDPIRIGRDFPAIHTNINWAIVGFTYFVNLDVAFSLWFFNVLTMLQIGTFNRFGYSLPGLDIYTLGGHPAIGWQSFGAMIVLVANMSWMARGHLGDIWRKAIRGDDDVDDSNELMSYRGIVFGGGFSLLYISFWMSAPACRFPRSCSLFSRRSFSIPALRASSWKGSPLLARAAGWPNLCRLYASPYAGPESNIALGLSYGWHHELKGFFMVASANSAKISDHMQLSRRTITFCVMAAAFVALVVSMAFILYMGYSFGAYNYGGWIFGDGSKVPYAESLRKIGLSAPDWTRLMHLGIGGGIMSALTFMRYRFPWWPLHPIGMPVGVCSYPMTIIVFSIFVSWLLSGLLCARAALGSTKRHSPFLSA